MTDQELEQRLRSWYRAEIGEDDAAPLSLRRDVAAIPRTPSRAIRRFGRGRGITLFAAAALLLVGATAAGSGLLRLPSLVPPAPLPPLAVVAPPSPAEESSNAFPSPTPNNAFPARSGMFDAAGSVFLASDSVGWVRTGSATIYRTRDMGATWTDVRPPGLSTMGLARFVDADTMYVTSTNASSGGGLMTGGPMTIAATHDGGTFWVEATIDSPRLMAGADFSFRTPDSGTLTFFTQDGRDLRVFATADGGRTWTGPVRSSAPRLLWQLKDLSGYSNSFGTDRVLVLGLAMLPPGTPFDNSLNLSMDGGVTWIKPSFPIGSHSPQAAIKQATGLWADGTGRIVLAMDIFDGDLQIYTSADDGQTWHFVKDMGRSAGHVQLLSATEWIFRTDAGVLSTVDGGGHWRTTVGVSKIYFADTSFASPDHGWGLFGCFNSYNPNPYCGPGVNDGPAAVFLATIDGGRTWTRIGG
jgi:photosystem II stability/assembly factor-like uncharacterized protein